MTKHALGHASVDFLAKLAERLKTESGFHFDTVADVPERLLSMWRVEKVWADEDATFHFYGYDHGGSCGRVSTAILSFDPSTMAGKTESGRIYHLIGKPGFCDDADYVMTNWFSRFRHEDGTDEFIRKYKAQKT